VLSKEGIVGYRNHEVCLMLLGRVLLKRGNSMTFSEGRILRVSKTSLRSFTTRNLSIQKRRILRRKNGHQAQVSRQIQSIDFARKKANSPEKWRGGATRATVRTS